VAELCNRRQARFRLTPGRLVPRPDYPPAARSLRNAGAREGRRGGACAVAQQQSSDPPRRDDCHAAEAIISRGRTRRLLSDTCGHGYRHGGLAERLVGRADLARATGVDAWDGHLGGVDRFAPGGAQRSARRLLRLGGRESADGQGRADAARQRDAPHIRIAFATKPCQFSLSARQNSVGRCDKDECRPPAKRNPPHNGSQQ
jgi:hypothetical protein